MRTLAMIAFIAGAAALAVALARMPTVASGQVMAADLLEQVRDKGVTRLDCDPEIPIGIDGATFTCIATLESGATQVVAYTLLAGGDLTWKAEPPAAAGARNGGNSAPGDPWSD